MILGHLRLFMIAGLSRRIFKFACLSFLASLTSRANAALVPSQFAGKPLPVLCNRSMERFVLPLAHAFQRLQPDVDFKLDMAVRFPFDRSALGTNVAEVYDDMSGAAFKAQYGYEPLAIMVSAGGRHQPDILQAIGVLVHPSNPLASLSMDQLEQIYAKTPRGAKPPVTTWGQLGLTGEWADRRIVIYGVTHFGGAPGGIFNERVVGGGELADDCRELIHSPPMIKAVATDPGAIGYIAMCYVTPAVKTLSLVPRNDTHAFEPTEANVQNLGYPLGVPLYFSVNRSPGRPLDPTLKKFLTLALSPEGQKIISAEGYLPLPPEALQRELAKLQ